MEERFKNKLLSAITGLSVASLLIASPGVYAKEVADMGAPSAPINLSGSGSLGNQVTLNWDFGTYDLSTNFGFPDTFVIYRTTGSNTSFANAQPLAVISSNMRSYTDMSVSGDTRYNYKVAARLGDLESGNSVIETVTTAPGVFMPAAEALGASRVRLTWNMPSLSGVQKYNIYRAPVSGGYVLIGSTTDMTYTDSGLTGNTYYAYHIKPVTTMGEDYGGLAYVTTLAADRVATPSSAPVVRGNPVTPTINNLEWNMVNDATEYRIYRRMSNEQSSVLLATTSKLGFPDMSVKSGYSYFYSVKAANEFGESVASTEVEIKTAVPRAPIIVGKVSGRNTISLSWLGVTDAQSYNIYRSIDGRGFTVAGSVMGTVTTFTDKDLQYETLYYYYIKAKAGANDGSIGDEGEKSNTVELKTASQFASLEAPVVTGRALSRSSAELRWNEVSGAASYIIQRDYADQAITGIGLFPGTGVIVTGTSYTDTQAFPISRYTYTVSAIDANGMGGNPARVTVDMSAPQNVTPTPTDFKVTVTRYETPALEFRSPRGLGVENPAVRRGNVFRFSYVYKNLTTKSQRVRVVRQVVSSSGKIITTTGANSSILAGRTVLFSPTIPTSPLVAGTYTVNIKIYDTVGSNYGKILAEKSFTFSVK